MNMKKFGKGLKGLSLVSMVLGVIAMIVDAAADHVNNQIVINDVNDLLDKRLGPGEHLYEEEENEKENG